MNDRVLAVMTAHLNYAEKYIESLGAAASVDDCVKAMKTCASEVKAQYPDLEEICGVYQNLMLTGASDELRLISEKTGDCLGRKAVELMPKIAQFMADDEYVAAQKELDDVLMNNPLFGGYVSDDSHIAEVAQGFAGIMTQMTEKLHAETTEVSAEDAEKIEHILEKLTASAAAFNSSLSFAKTSRKAVEACDMFVASLNRLMPDMTDSAEAMRLMTAKGDIPQNIVALSKKLSDILGAELKEIIKEKQEIMQEQKVKKAVKKLGDLLEKLPF